MVVRSGTALLVSLSAGPVVFAPGLGMPLVFVGPPDGLSADRARRVSGWASPCPQWNCCCSKYVDWLSTWPWGVAGASAVRASMKRV